MDDNATPARKRPHLGEWTRVGIVASVLWVLGAGQAWVAHQARNADAAYSFTHDICIQLGKEVREVDLDVCRKEAMNSYRIALEHRYAKAATVAFAPLPFFWLIAWGISTTYRWARRGFTH